MRTRFLRYAPSKSPFRFRLGLLPVAALAVLLAGCGGDDDGGGTSAAASNSGGSTSAEQPDGANQRCGQRRSATVMIAV
jgi:hypothetical protein